MPLNFYEGGSYLYRDQRFKKILMTKDVIL